MGNEYSTGGGDGVPFVCWRRAPLSVAPAEDIQGHLHAHNGEALAYHFAEASSYKYDRTPRLVTGDLVFTDPPRGDGELRNKPDLLGSIAVVERGGRLHFPDIVRRLLVADVIGIVFIERTDNKLAVQSLFDGFHSSGRQSMPIPIVLLSKFHADQLLRDQPARISIERLSGEQATKFVVSDDIYFGVASAARAGDVDLLRHLLLMDASGSASEQNFPKAVALCDAAENGHVDCIEVLHGFGVSLDEQKPNGTSALMMACSVGNVEAARALLMFGASLDLEDVHGFTALMIAVRDCRPSCVKLLIRKGARINLSRNRSRGTTALHIAARSGHDECCSILIDGGAELDTLSPNSTTALMEAARAGKLGCVKILANAGAGIDAKDCDGNNAEALARLAGHTDVENFLREQAESESVKDHRRKFEETITRMNSTLADVMQIAKKSSISVDALLREITRDHKSSTWLEHPPIIYEVFRLLTISTSAPESMVTEDPMYGKYTVQHFCCEIALSYTRKIFHKHAGDAGWTPAAHEEWNMEAASGYLKVLFKFVCTSEPLDEVLLVLFCKVINNYVVNQELGALFWHFLANDGHFVIPWLVSHIGLDSIHDTFVWLLYSDMTEAGQENVRKSGIFDSLFARLYSWQRTLGWGVGTSFQRDSVENICSVINYIVYPPSVYIMNGIATFVENTDNTLPLITDQHFPLHHNELFKTLLTFLLHSTDVSFGTLLNLGYSEILRQTTAEPPIVMREGGALSIVMELMSTLGYHKKRRDVTGIDALLKSVTLVLLQALVPQVEKFVKLCQSVVSADMAALENFTKSSDKRHSAPMKSKGSALLSLIAFLKRCVFLQSGHIDYLLAHFNLMPCFLACYDSHPNNSLLHHELTDVIRFVLMDPDQKRLPSCPLLNGLFVEGANILDFVIRAYDLQVQYKGHMTTIANSVFTLTNTPNCRSGPAAITCQEVVRQYTSQHQKWLEFEAKLAEQNLIEMQPLGQRHAPLCHGCLKVKENAVEYVTSTFAENDIEFTGYLETIFSGPASHVCKLNYTDDFLSGFMYKKDKIHDHIPIPEPTRVSSFIQFPVPMPFHALTFTLTYFGLCQVCDKLWYCDTLHSANWANRMKWVMPTSVRKWYSFGVTAGPGSGAHGIQFSTKGYKSFIVLTDTWGRQEQWVHGLEESIEGLSAQMARRMASETAIAIEIDNEVDADQFDLSGFANNGAGNGSIGGGARSRSNTDGKALEREAAKAAESTAPRRKSGGPASSTAAVAPTNPTGDSMDVPENPLAMLPPKTINVRGGKPRNLDLKRFQPDTRKFSEILQNLKMASPPRVNVRAGPLPLHAQIPPTPPASSTLSPSGPESLGLRHVVSTPNLAQMRR